MTLYSATPSQLAAQLIEVKVADNYFDGRLYSVTCNGRMGLNIALKDAVQVSGGIKQVAKPGGGRRLTVMLNKDCLPTEFLDTIDQARILLLQHIKQVDPKMEIRQVAPIYRTIDGTNRILLYLDLDAEFQLFSESGKPISTANAISTTVFLKLVVRFANMVCQKETKTVYIKPKLYQAQLVYPIQQQTFMLEEQPNQGDNDGEMDNVIDRILDDLPNLMAELPGTQTAPASSTDPKRKKAKKAKIEQQPIDLDTQFY